MMIYQNVPMVRPIWNLMNGIYIVARYFGGCLTMNPIFVLIAMMDILKLVVMGTIVMCADFLTQLADRKRLSYAIKTPEITRRLQ